MTNELTTADVESLTEKAYQAISSAIARLDLRPGQSFTQERLAKWLAISRTPVREALRRLAQEGIIQTVPGRRMIVTELTVKDAEDMFEMLCLLETHAACLAAQRRTPEQAERLVGVAQELLLAAERQDIEAWSTVDRSYHDLLLEAAGNQVLRRSVADVRKRLQRVTYHLAGEPAQLLPGTREHVELAHAVRDLDAQLAATIMRQHLATLVSRAMELIRNYIVPTQGERF